LYDSLAEWTKLTQQILLTKFRTKCRVRHSRFQSTFLDTHRIDGYMGVQVKMKGSWYLASEQILDLYYERRRRKWELLCNKLSNKF